VLLADRGYDSDALREALAAQGAWGNIKPMPGRVNIPVFSPFLYRLRNLVERAYSTKSNTSVPSRRVSKNTTPITSRSSNSPPSKYGCDL